jgi:hypothetical protein
MSSDRPPSAPLPEPSPVEYGGRVELRLVQSPEAESAEDARYAARWFTADLTLEGEVTISPEGTQVKVEAPEALPDWLESFTTTLVRTTARSAKKDNAWPRRLTRWRRAPAESESEDE